jgi:hypothetical protein
MKPVPNTEESLLLRVDYTDDAAWDALCAMVQQRVGEFRAYVTPFSDPAYADITLDEIIHLASHPDRSFVLVADRRALMDPDHPLLVVDLLDEPGRTFRVIPSETWSVENNLSLANMGFEEFAEALDANGVFRGFR